jgi:CheY-like chemotaxis protein
MAKPVIIVVDDEDDSLATLTRELESRYGAHYLVAACASPGQALATLAELRAGAPACRWSWPTSGWPGSRCS